LSEDHSTRDFQTGPPSGGESPGDALVRAREHARNAAAESVAALRALLDAAALGIAAVPAEQHHRLATLARLLDDLSARLSRDHTAANTDVSSLILDALDAEIKRWEARSQDDSDSRAVLRAFLGMREILWEFGIRSPAPTPRPESRDDSKAPATRRRRPPRVQRVEVQG
jgi:hypothetical protein